MRSHRGIAATFLAACTFGAVLETTASIARAEPDPADAEQTPPPIETRQVEKATAASGVATTQDSEQPSTDRYFYELKAPQVVHIYDMNAGLCMTPTLALTDGWRFDVLRTIQEKTASPCNANEYCPANKKQLLLKVWPPQPGPLARKKAALERGGDVARRDDKAPASSSKVQYVCLEKDTFDELTTEEAIVKRYQRGSSGPVYGLSLTLPIKIRRATAGFNTTLTQNIEIGGLLGWRWRISDTLDYHVDFPVATAGLANLEIEKGRSPTAMDGNAQSMGVTASAGVILELTSFQLGFMVGVDRATGDLGRGWVYNGKPWYAFGLGYSFLTNSPK